jgi:hypothetical protein
MTNLEMIKKLQFSKSEVTAFKCKQILNGQSTIENELKYSGGFLTAVLKGDFEEALARADFENKKILLEL